MDISSVGGPFWSPLTKNKEKTGQDLLGNLVTAATSNTKIDAGPGKAPDGAVTEFMDYMKKTPEQRWQDAWLSAHGITPEEFAAMSPAEKQKILTQMREDMEAKMKAESEDPSKRKVDILA